MTPQVVRTYTRGNGADLPPGYVVEWIRGGQRKYRWRCTRCGVGRQTVAKSGAFEDCWEHECEENER